MTARPLVKLGYASSEEEGLTPLALDRDGLSREDRYAQRRMIRGSQALAKAVREARSA